MNAPAPAWTRTFGRRVTDLAIVEPSRPAARVAVGSRWNPTHAVVRDPDSGIYFERNPRMETSAELDVQRALLTQRANNRGRYWLAAALLFAATFFFVKAAWQ